MLENWKIRKETCFFLVPGFWFKHLTTQKHISFSKFDMQDKQFVYDLRKKISATDSG